jgi:hypothetical protein
MKKMVFPHESSIKMTKEQAEELKIDISKDEIHGDLKTIGMWNIPVSFKAQCIDTLYEYDADRFGIVPKEVTFFGKRTMTNLRQSGYELEGWVSIGGKKYTAFTSSVLIEVEGKLINVAVISARYTKFPEL